MLLLGRRSPGQCHGASLERRSPCSWGHGLSPAQPWSCSLLAYVAWLHWTNRTHPEICKTWYELNSEVTLHWWLDIPHVITWLSVSTKDIPHVITWLSVSTKDIPHVITWLSVSTKDIPHVITWLSVSTKDIRHVITWLSVSTKDIRHVITWLSVSTKDIRHVITWLSVSLSTHLVSLHGVCHVLLVLVGVEPHTEGATVSLQLWLWVWTYRTHQDSVTRQQTEMFLFI